MITKTQAMECGVFYHVRATYAALSGGGAYQARVNGKCKTWKRDPNRFELPIKVGYKGYAYINNRTASEWVCVDFRSWFEVCKAAGLDCSTAPLFAVVDRLIDRNLEDVAELVKVEFAYRASLPVG